MKLFTSLTLQCIFLWNFLSAEILETAHFIEINQHVRVDSLVILDIDDTLLIPKQTLGTDAWFCYRLNLLKKELPFEEALDRALAEWEAIRHLTDIKLVESDTEKTIQNLQNQNIMVMGLTTQGLALATRTVNQLLSLGIDLSKTAPSNEDHYFINQHGVLYREGILFTSGTPKGTALFKLLDILHIQPKHVIFINDKETHLLDVAHTVESNNIPFTGLRYSFCDNRVANFDPIIADIQWNHSSFGKILSDEEALLYKSLQIK